MTSPTKVQLPSFSLQISGELYSPAPGLPDRKGAAVFIGHPMTGVKEQGSAIYARALAEAGFFALAWDAGYQGESTGLPRGLEDPHQRVKDFKAAVTYLTTLTGKVDPERIGALGICASGGYSSYATQSDRRIKALGTVSAACVGRLTRNGGLHEHHNQENPDAIAGALQAAGQWRTQHANDLDAEAPKMFETDIDKLPADADSFFADAAQYYGSERGSHERSHQRVPLSSYDLMIGYDSFNLQHLISPRPLLMIAGELAQTLHYSNTAVATVKELKEVYVVKAKNYFDLYDDVTETGPKLVEFFSQALC
ncbi:hypothetical protein ACHAPT_011087 [Fusarium lateritium]